VTFSQEFLSAWAFARPKRGGKEKPSLALPALGLPVIRKKSFTVDKIEQCPPTSPLFLPGILLTSSSSAFDASLSRVLKPVKPRLSFAVTPFFKSSTRPLWLEWRAKSQCPRPGPLQTQRPFTPFDPSGVRELVRNRMPRIGDMRESPCNTPSPSEALERTDE